MDLLSTPHHHHHLATITSDISTADSDSDTESIDNLIISHTTANSAPSAPARRHGHNRTMSNASRASSSGSILPIRRRLTDAQQQQKNLLQVMLLEAGILFHSVFIGMALSVATGSNFIVLLIAISFHRTSPQLPPPVIPPI